MRGAVRQEGGGRLVLVATPIGNLGDVTHRALAVLAAVPLIAAEDTRLSRRLLDRYEIKTPMTSFHAQSGPARLASLVRCAPSARAAESRVTCPAVAESQPLPLPRLPVVPALCWRS